MMQKIIILKFSNAKTTSHCSLNLFLEEFIMKLQSFSNKIEAIFFKIAGKIGKAEP